MKSFELLSEMVEKANGSQEAKNELKGFDKVFQFNPSDAEPFYVTIKEGNIQIAKGKSENVAATISATDDLLAKVLSGQANAVTAFMGGSLKVSGDIFSAQKLTSIASKFKR
ncbi:MAG: SCP2 sterol-binding domain-containing protein [Thermoplasmataceae archaeon]|jgi:putative sterol carrier protein